MRRKKIIFESRRHELERRGFRILSELSKERKTYYFVRVIIQSLGKILEHSLSLQFAFARSGVVRENNSFFCN